MVQPQVLLDNARIIAGVFTTLAVLFSLWLIYKHLRNYTSPHLQRYIVRILLMVPIYAIDSWLSLRLPSLSLIWDLARDCYEAYCIFCFFGLMVTYVQEENMDVGHLLEKKGKLAHPFPLCFLPRIQLGKKFLRQCYQFILQFVFVKPVLSLTAVILYYKKPENYNEEDIFLANNGYLWLTLIENVSITLSLYYLVLYYMAVKVELAPFHPIGKFLCIKAVIFFSFWQGIIITLLSTLQIVHQYSGMSEANVGRVIQDFIICIEMFVLSIVHQYVFPYQGFRDPNKVPFLWDKRRKRPFVNASSSLKPVMSHFFEVANVSDILVDTRKSFGPVRLNVSSEGVTPAPPTDDRLTNHSNLIIEEYDPNQANENDLLLP